MSRHRKEHWPLLRLHLGDFISERIEIVISPACKTPVSAVDHSQIRRKVPYFINFIYLRMFRIIAGEQQLLSLKLNQKPDTALAVPRSPPHHRHAALKRNHPSALTQMLDRHRIRIAETKHVIGEAAGNDPSGKAVFQKKRQRSRMIGMTVGQKEILRIPYLFTGQPRIRAARRLLHETCIDNKRRFPAFYKKTVSPMF